MQLVDDRLYILYNRAAMVLGAVFTLLAIASWTLPPLAILRQGWGLTPLIGILGVTQIVYGLVLFKRQSSAWIGGLFAAAILLISTVALIQSSGQVGSWFFILWLLQVFISGIYGLYTLMIYCFIITVQFV